MLATARRVPRALASVVAAALALPSVALANGAFPDGFSVILRAERPREIVVATNFGLVVSEDDGRTWRYSCEDENEARNTDRFIGEAGPPHRIFAVGQRQGGTYGLVVTGDDGCTWQPAMTGALHFDVRDYFVEPGPPGRILALADQQAEGGLAHGLFVSSDGGKSFGAPLRTAPPGVTFGSVETARSDPALIYLVIQEGQRARLERSGDGGRTWQARAFSEAWGEQFFIVAVDPEDGQRLLVRAVSYVGGFAVDRLLFSRDGGATWKVAIDLSLDGGGALGAYLRRADGTLLVAGQMHRPGAPAAAFESRDRGESWSQWDIGGLHARGLGERDGMVYVVTSELADGSSLARGRGGGAEWEHLLRYAQIAGIRPCAQARCQASCLNLATAFVLFPRDRCDPPGGARPADGGAGAGPSGGPDGGVMGGTGGGCGCALPGRSGPAGLLPAAVMAMAVVVWRRRRRPRASEGGS